MRLTVRPERVEDPADVRAVVAAAFADHAVAALVDDLRAGDAWRGLSFVAEEHTGAHAEVVGHVCFTRGWLDAAPRLVEVLVLGPLSVRPDRQRSGVGTTLVGQALERLADRAEPLVFLEGSAAYYPRFGFVPGGTLGFRAPSERIPEAAFQVRRLASYEPWMSGALVYPDAFWRHDSVGLRG